MEIIIIILFSNTLRDDFAISPLIAIYNTEFDYKFF